MTLQVGFIGAGQMGEPMVVRLLESGHRTQVYVRNADTAARLQKRGAVVADTLAELASTADIVICCLFSDAQLFEVTLGENGVARHMRPGSILISHTTGSVDAVLRIQEEAGSRVEVLDAPVSGTAEEISQGGLTVLIGGAQGSVDLVKPILSAYADSILWSGGLGSALNVKLINNLLFAANVQLVADAVRIARGLDVDQDALLAALAVCSGSSGASERALQTGGVERFAEIAGPFLQKDFEACVEAAEKGKTDIGLLGAVVREGLFDFDPSDTDDPRRAP
ncbi:NAD(P)-dependent oxidoreductase [Tomitella biformata]|uniref:NAD(P)-dependent oxidoreductase n=1 Tax=Tomitella biformata TaxID=630403 RepID=UPI00046507AC|nr:NAD(P)-dependent oxidoreductase [Tomitella biformata]